MTVICVKNNIMAADSCLSRGDMRVGTVTKIAIANKGHNGDFEGSLLGASGHHGFCNNVLDRFGTASDMPRIGQMNDDNASSFLCMTHSGLYCWDNSGYWFPVEQPFAIGCGSSLALGAMLGDMTSYQAAGLVADRIDGCGRPIMWATLGRSATVIVGHG